MGEKGTMKKSFGTSVLAMGMICTMTILGACGNKENVALQENADSEPAIDKDHVYRWEDIDLPIKDSSYCISSCSTEDSFFTLIGYYEGSEAAPEIMKVDYASGVVTELPLQSAYNIAYSEMTADEDENLYLIKTVYTDDWLEAYENEEEIAYSEKFRADNTTSTIVKLSAEGDIIWEKPLTETDSKKTVGSMAYVKGRGILTYSRGASSFYDENTDEGEEIIGGNDDSSDDYYFGNLYTLRDGNVYLYDNSYNENGLIIKKFNPDTMDFDEEVSIPNDAQNGNRIYPGKAFDFYVEERSGIKVFNLGDEQMTLVCDFESSDIVINYLTYIGDDENGKIFVINEMPDEGSELASLTKINPSEITEKEIITVGTIFISDEVRKRVSKFNKNSEKYRIKLIDYANESGGTDLSGYFECVDKIGLELVQGQGPDIMVVYHSAALQNYAKKGVFEPLDSYFENDPDISISDLLPNVVDATRVNGELYTVVPSFYVNTCVAAKDKLGNQKVTLENYKEICEANGIDPVVGMGYMTRDAATDFYETTGSTFINYENGTCSFDSEGFVNLLKFINQFPEETEDDEDNDEWEEYETYFRQNKALLLDYTLASFQDYKLLLDGYFGTDVEFNGYPTNDGGKSFLSMGMQIAMNHNCKYKDAAWEFMKSFYDYDYRNKLQRDFPIKKSALEAMAAKAQERPYYTNSKGEEVYTGDILGIGNEEYQLDELSKEETETVIDFISSVTDVSTNEIQIENIITEEAGAYYENQKSAEEVADIIQSRVSIYLSENR